MTDRMTSQCHCDAKEVPRTHDWLVWFAHKVASEDARRFRLPGSSWCLMLREDEAHAVVGQLNDLVQQQTVTESAAPPITEERPRDVGAPGAAT